MELTRKVLYSIQTFRPPTNETCAWMIFRPPQCTAFLIPAAACVLLWMAAQAVLRPGDAPPHRDPPPAPPNCSLALTLKSEGGRLGHTMIEQVWFLFDSKLTGRRCCKLKVPCENKQPHTCSASKAHTNNMSKNHVPLPNSKDSKEKQENGGSVHILISQLQAALYNLSRRFGVSMSAVVSNSLRKSNYYFSFSCPPSLRGLAAKRRTSSPPASPPPRWAAAGTA